ncbi:nucleotidyl transferase AbiEii/AbiGii toxin family protein [Halomonas sp. 7T]|uniref:nucleotidyl transferase AbiEii/AbiGii toxin family protein n=1 Tax=Halomonas sp. 7T TaxID=2893469 RepID=UPI0021D8B7DC|nr:nucleotidyl transferase AbiEii/AbiGii toxin family protein [Halomonas sp. 7T]UXZ53399.1 nucleotidyl transferase AbiEii/AbiGii toxin family protein [Halomonas sp. 7T]
MSSWDKRYSDRVQLLVDILPVLAKETRFALKGGTAINLFEHNLPRLSVDIDLTWLPVQDFETGVAEIAAALEQLAETLRARPLQLHVQTSGGANTGGITRLICSRGRARVQIETTPVMRGTVHPVRTMVVQPEVEQAFGFASTQVLSFADLYAGKLAAALSRQHPRDLFDIGLMLEDERADATLWQTFLVYLACSPKPAWELLAPREPVDFEAIFDSHFKGMTAKPVTVVQLLENRAHLLRWISKKLDKPSCDFLWSVEDEQPDFALIELEGVAALPGVGRKLQNLTRRSKAKRQADRHELEQVLARIASDA